MCTARTVEGWSISSSDADPIDRRPAVTGVTVDQGGYTMYCWPIGDEVLIVRESKDIFGMVVNQWAGVDLRTFTEPLGARLGRMVDGRIRLRVERR